MTRLEPVPYLAVDGVDVARGPAGGPLVNLLAMDGLTVNWGRQEVLEQPDAADGQVQLFDPARSWHRQADRIGARVDLRWEITVNGVTTKRTFFRGRIVSVNPVLTTLGGVRGSLITLTLSSILADLGNTIPAVDWPWEGMPARRARISAAVVAAGITGGVTTRTDWDALGWRDIKAKDQPSILDQLVLLYDSLVDRMDYNPDTNAITAVGDRDYRTRNTLGRLASDPVGSDSDRAGQGVYVRARSMNGGAGLYLDAREVDYPDDAGISRDQTNAVTRLRMSFTDVAVVNGAYVWTDRLVEKVLSGTNEAATGVRAVTLTIGIDAGLVISTPIRFEAQLRPAIAAWQLEPIAQRTDATGGWEELGQVLELLSGHESNALVFLQSSDLPLLGVCPVFAVMGGSIVHRDGNWEPEWTLFPVAPTASQHPIAWEEFDTGTPATQVAWWDTPHPLGMHESLTFEDLAWVGMGHGMAEPWPGSTYTSGDYLP